MEEVVLRRMSAGDARFRALLDRHGAFWRRGEEGFLRVTAPYHPSLPVGLPQRDGRVVTFADVVTPDLVDPALLIDQAERVDLAAPGGLEILHSQYLAYAGCGDAPPRAEPFSKIPWLEAMLGCPITMTEGHIWSKPYAGDPQEVIAAGARIEHSAWFQLYLEFLHQLPPRLGRRFLISANTLLRGACDLVAAIMGVQGAAMGWLDAPSFMARLLRVCTDAILRVVEGGYRVLPPVHGGYASTWDIWGPAPIVATQADHASLLSARIYGAQILPFDLEVARACPLCVFHLHNNGLHLAPALVERPEVSAIEVVVDPYPTGQRKAWEVAMLQRIQQHKPLILNAEFPSYAESAWLLNQLDRRGLLFNARFAADAVDLPVDMPASEAWILFDGPPGLANSSLPLAID
jgi:hypothetical protein